MSKPSVILLGSKPGAIVALELMLNKGWNVVAVVPSGNHTFVTGDTITDIALKHSLPIKRQNELCDLKVDFVISYMFRDKVTVKTLSLAKTAALNFHAAPLPEYGGWAFYNMAILEGAKEYGCTCHHMDEGFDTGPILKVRRFPIHVETETAVSLEHKAQEEMILLFQEFMELAESGADLPKVEQEHSKMRYLKRNEFEKLKRVDINASQEVIQRTARAFFYPPYECAYIEVGGVRVEIIPEIIKERLATELHKDDLSHIREVASLSI